MSGLAAEKKAPMAGASSVRNPWQFVFTATGKETDVDDLTMVDVYDNLIVEAERLAAIEDLLLSNADSGIESSHGLALLLGDIRRRMQMILELALAKRESKGLRTRRKQ